MPFQVTGRAHNRHAFPIPLDEMWSLVSERLYLCVRAFEIEILSFVLMPNHFHLLVRDPKMQISRAMGDFMRETAKEVNRRSRRQNQLWGRRYSATLIRDLDHFFACYKYIYQNPLRAGLCSRVEAYPYSTLAGLLGQTHLLIPVREDETLFADVERSLAWLNQGFEGRTTELIRLGLSRKVFAVAPDPRTKRKRELAEHP